MKERVAIVTGGANGIGRAIAIRLAKEGASVAVPDIDEANSNNTVNEIKRLGSTGLSLRCDVSDSSDVKRAVRETVGGLGEPGILINNAGIGYATGSITDPSHVLIENLTEEEWDKVINTNLKSVFLFCKEVVPFMKKQKWGKIINISSVAAFTGHGSSGGSGPAYGASKAGIVNLTKTLARQLGSYNINVNCIAPGSVPETAFKMSEEEIKAEQSLLPLHRLGRASDIAEMAAFLCSNSAEWMTGQTINVNGGELM